MDELLMLSWDQVASLRQGGGQHNHREVDVVGVPVHELTDAGRPLHQELLLTAYSVVNRALLEPVQLVDPAVLGHERDEVGVAGTTRTGLSLPNCLLVLVHDLRTVLEDVGAGFGVLAQGLLAKLVEKGARGDDGGVLLLGVHDDVEEGDGPAGIDGVLLHVEDIGRHLLWLERGLLGNLELSLGRTLLVEHHDAEHGFGDHLKGPLLEGEQLLERIGVGLQSQFGDVAVDDLGVAFQLHPVLIAPLLHIYQRITYPSQI